MPVGISAGSCSASTLGIASYENQDENASSHEDLNKNGIPDAAEKIENGILLLSPSKKIAQYGESIDLKAGLYESDGKTLISDDSFSDVSFSLSKLVSIENNKKTTIYDINNSALNDTGALADYVNFQTMKVRAQA